MRDGQKRTDARMVEGRDYRFDERGLMVLTSAYLLSRGVCCGSKCRNCPFSWENVLKEDRIEGEPQPPLDE